MSCTTGNDRLLRQTSFTFTVTLPAAYDQAVTMSYRTVDSTAKTSDADYIAKTGTLTFAPGETTKTITIEVKGDSKKEANEIAPSEAWERGKRCKKHHGNLSVELCG
jgi:hypothetical protein